MIRYLFILILFLPSISSSEERDILINRILAERLQCKAGDRLELSTSGDMKRASTFRVAAIYQEEADPYNATVKRNLIKMHLSDLETLTGRKDQLDLISVQLRKDADPRTFVARLNAEAIGFTAHSAEELASHSSTTFQVVNRFHRAISLITMTAGAIFIFALMVMRVEDQRKNLAILSITGISRNTIFRTLVLESTCFAFLASLLGAALGIGATIAVNAYYQRYYETTLRFAEVNGSILLQAVILSFLLGLIAGAFSWFRFRQLNTLQELGR